MTEYHFNITLYKPAGGLLAGFSLLPYVLIALAYFAPYKAAKAAKKALHNMPNWHGIVLYNLHKFQLLRPFPFFLQIQLDESNYHIFPPCFAQMKWKIEGSSAHKHERTLHFFTFFPAIYSTYNGSAREKSTWIFSCAYVRIRSNEISPSNICLYTIAATLRKQTRQAWRLESTTGISCLG